MKQYLELLKNIKEKGTYKEPAREGMPGTISLFGYQMRFNLQEGFPLVTTKKISFKNIVVELLWFLKGDTNIKYLVDNSCNIWNEDAYNYYLKVCKGKLPIELLGDTLDENSNLTLLTFEEFVTILKVRSYNKLPKYNNYTLGDCGKQYGWLWRSWDKEPISLEDRIKYVMEGKTPLPVELENLAITEAAYDPEQTPQYTKSFDQLKELLSGLKNNPMGRRHIITAWNPATLDDMALNACHAFVQFNCRPIEENLRELGLLVYKNGLESEIAKNFKKPLYYLDCQLYQRSADVFLGVPYNIASYALLTEILCKICNYIPGDYIHTFGDVHIYEDHLDAVNEQLQREPKALPKLNINTEFWQTESGECGIGDLSIDGFLKGLSSYDFLKCLLEEDIQLSNYTPQPTIKVKLSTGLR